MKISGFEGFHNALPDYSEKQAKLLVFRLPLIAILSLLVQILSLFLIQWLSRTVQSSGVGFIETIIPIVFNLTFVLGGSIVAQQGFLKKNQYLANFGVYAYQKIVKTILFGISMVFAGDLFGYLPIINSSASMAQFFSSPFDSALLVGIFLTTRIVRIILAVIMLVIALLTALRAIQNFGIDTASMVYVYFPEKAQVVENEIYSIVRHPMYLAVILVSIGVFMVNFSFYGSFHLLITLGSFYRHIFYIEDKELVERFGDSYTEYSKTTPAIFIRPKNWGKFFKFLLNTKN